MAIAYRSTATAGVNSTTITNNVPAGTVDGDILLWAVAANFNASSPTFATPAGWTVILNNNNADRQITVFAKTASSEPASYAITPSVTGFSGGGRMIAYSGGDGLDVSSGAYFNTATTSYVAGSVTTTKTNETLVGIYLAKNLSTSFTPAGTMTERADSSAGNGYTIEVCDEVIAATGATGTRTATCAGSFVGAAFLVSIFVNPTSVVPKLFFASL